MYPLKNSFALIPTLLVFIVSIVPHLLYADSASPFIRLINGMTRVKSNSLAAMYARAVYSITKKEVFPHYYATQEEGPDYIKIKTVIAPVYKWHKDNLIVDQTDTLETVVATIDNEQKRLLKAIGEYDTKSDHNKEADQLKWTTPFAIDATTKCLIMLTDYPCAVCETVVPAREYLRDQDGSPLARLIRSDTKRENMLNKAFEVLAHHDTYILHESAKAGSMQMVESALIKGADANKEVPFFMVDNATPLMIAVLSGCAGCVRMLIEYGAVDTNNRALILASGLSSPNKKILRILIEGDREKRLLAKRYLQENTELASKEKQELIGALHERKRNLNVS